MMATFRNFMILVELIIQKNGVWNLSIRSIKNMLLDSLTIRLGKYGISLIPTNNCHLIEIKLRKYLVSHVSQNRKF